MCVRESESVFSLQMCVSESVSACSLELCVRESESDSVFSFRCV